MMRTLAAIALLFTTGCVTTARVTTEYDPAAVASANYWNGVFWLAVVICGALVLIAWFIVYAISERAKYGPKR